MGLIGETKEAAMEPRGQQPTPAEGGERLRGAGEEPATPEEQEAFTRVEAAAMEIVYDEETKGPLFERLKAGADTPAETLGQAAIMVFAQIDEQSGGNVPETVLLQGMTATLSVVAQHAEEAGIIQADDRMRVQAMNFMLMEAVKMGYITEADLEALQELIQSMPPEELQGIVSQQEQAMGGQVNG